MLPGVGIFGTGPLARTIVIYLKECGFNVAAVWSRNMKAAEQFAKEHEIPLCTNKADDLLLKSEVGFVVIVCTPHLQSQIAVKALGIGKHVIASWPAGTSQLEVLRMVKKAAYFPRLLSMMCHGMRFLPTYSLMKEKLTSGYIGELFLFEIKVHHSHKLTEYNWQCDSMMGGGALSVHGSYIIDMISYLSGAKITAVNGMIRTYVKNTELISGVRQITCDDVCSFQMELEDGITASCVINNLYTGDALTEISAVGSKGSLTASNLKLVAKLNDSESVEELSEEKSDTSEKITPIDEAGRIPFHEGLHEALKKVSESFLAVSEIHGWDPSIIPNRASFDDALYVQTVIDSIKKSSQTRQWVNIKILDEEPDPNPHLSSVVRRSAYSAF